jgi:hypothetical protein
MNNEHNSIRVLRNFGIEQLMTKEDWIDLVEEINKLNKPQLKGANNDIELKMDGVS